MQFGTPQAEQQNVALEYARNAERYDFLKWGSKSLDNFKVVPPGTGICHQVNLEHIAQTVWTSTDASGATVAYPDTCVGTDSHTTMVNGLGVLGWGVGGIEAEAAMLGQPVSMLIPEVVGFRLTGALSEGDHRDRSGADRHADAPRQGRGRALRRVLRPRPRRAEPGRPRDDRQHGARIRRDLRFLSGRRQDHRIHAPNGARGKRDCADRGLCPRAGPVARRGRRRRRFHRHARARHVERPAVARRTEASAGPRVADRRRQPVQRRTSRDLQEPKIWAG